jgi:hypothetical protein
MDTRLDRAARGLTLAGIKDQRAWRVIRGARAVEEGTCPLYAPEIAEDIRTARTFLRELRAVPNGGRRLQATALGEAIDVFTSIVAHAFAEEACLERAAASGRCRY